MPFVFGIGGLLLIVAGVRGQMTALFTLVKSDFTGQPNYFEWMVAIFLVGAVGYVKQLQTISRMFLFLLIFGLIWRNKQVFSALTTEEKQQPTTPQNNATSPSTGTSTSSTTSNPLQTGQSILQNSGVGDFLNDDVFPGLGNLVSGPTSD